MKKKYISVACGDFYKKTSKDTAFYSPISHPLKKTCLSTM